MATKNRTAKGTDQITAMLPEGLIARLDAYASKRRWSRSAAIAALIEDGLDREQENTPGG